MPKVVDKQEKAAAIARAALGTFRAAGYHGARMADIARDAGVGKGTLYEYFADKAAILRFEFDRYFEAFRGEALAAIATADGPAAQLLALVELALDHTREWEDHCAVYVDCMSAARTGDGAPVSLAPIYDEMRALLEGLLAAGQRAGELRAEMDPSATADVLLSVFDGLVLHSVIEGRERDASALRAATLQLLRGGVLAKAR